MKSLRVLFHIPNRDTDTVDLADIEFIYPYPLAGSLLVLRNGQSVVVSETPRTILALQAEAEEQCARREAEEDSECP